MKSIKEVREHNRKACLLENYFNSTINDDDNIVVYGVDFRKVSNDDDGTSEVRIRYTTEYALSEDEFDKLIEKLKT